MRPPRVVHLASLVLTAIAMSDKPQPRPRDAYRHFLPITTRWMDNDVYGHVNNVVYYSYFDTVVNEYLIRAGVLDVEHGQTIGLVVETQCNYFAPLVFPQSVDAGLRVVKLGTSSVRYEVGLFAQGDATPAAQGTSCTCTSIAARAGRCRCPMRCAPRSSRSRPDGAVHAFALQAFNGLSYGLLLFMLSAGLTLIFSVQGVLNFAHASFYMLGAYVGYSIAAGAGSGPRWCSRRSRSGCSAPAANACCCAACRRAAIRANCC